MSMENMALLKSEATHLDTHDALRYVWLCWRITGSHPSDTHPWIYWTYSALLKFCSIFLFIGLYSVSFFTRRMFYEEWAQLSVLLPIIYTSTKHAVLLYYIRGDLLRAAKHLQTLDKRAEQNPEACNFLKQKVRWCHRISFVAITIFTISLTLYALVGIIQHKLPFGGWMPFDWQHSIGAYIFVCAFQMFCLFVQMLWSQGNDTYAIIYLLLLEAHLSVVNDRIARIGSTDGENEVDEEEMHRQLAACVQDHWECMRFFNCIQPAIAATMFVQFLSTAFALCTSAVAFSANDFSLLELMKLLLYLAVVMLEVAPCCWYMDEVLIQMHKLTNSLFSCRWYERNRKFRSSLIVFMQRSQLVSKILAGNIMPVSLETFVGIVKFAFSLFTLLKHLKA